MKRNHACDSVVVNDHFLQNSLLVHWINFLLAAIFKYTRFDACLPGLHHKKKLYAGWSTIFWKGYYTWDWLIKCCVKKLLYTLTSCTISNPIAMYVCYNRRNTTYNHSHKNFDKRQNLAFFISKGRFHQYLHQTQENELFRVLWFLLQTCSNIKSWKVQIGTKTGIKEDILNYIPYQIYITIIIAPLRSFLFHLDLIRWSCVKATWQHTRYSNVITE